MLTYIKITAQNNPYRGGIEIKSEANVDTLSNVTKIRIMRKVTGGSWNEIQSIGVSSIDDLNFSLLDISTISGKSYSYSFDVMNGTSIVENGLTDYIPFSFEGLFVGNFDKQYVAGSNFSVDSVQRNTSKTYVTTLSGKYPYAVSNANSNYTTGTASGLFLELTDDKRKFVPDYNHSYSNSIVDFLTDGTYKILKTHDGQAWFVSIDQNVSLPSNEHYTGMNAVQFNWTEIGDMPVFGMVVD